MCIKYAIDIQVQKRFFLGFINVSKSQNVISLVDAILSFLKVSKLDSISIITQSYDGANAMAGCKGGVQILLREHHQIANCYLYSLYGLQAGADTREVPW